MTKSRQVPTKSLMSTVHDQILVVANWKLAVPQNEVESFGRAVAALRTLPKNVDVVLCPSFPALLVIANVLQKSRVAVGSQDVFWERSGAFTGEVSVDDLRELGCQYVIVGHSERRQFVHETDEMIRRKVFTVMARGLNPILCVGETADQRRAGQSHHVVSRQLAAGLKNVPPPRHGQELIIAYEPVWAISPGGPAAPEDAFEMSTVIQQALVDHYGPSVASAHTRVLYGGSVDAANVQSFIDHERIHGVLVGGQSQHRLTFLALLRALSAKRRF